LDSVDVFERWTRLLAFAVVLEKVTPENKAYEAISAVHMSQLAPLTFAIGGPGGICCLNQISDQQHGKIQFLIRLVDDC
jgi:hypothetical protein